MKEAVTRNAVPQLRDEAGLSNAQQRPGFPLRSLRTLQGVGRGQSFFLALLAAVAAWHELVLLTFR
jgi:hypothetical protein